MTHLCLKTNYFVSRTGFPRFKCIAAAKKETYKMEICDSTSNKKYIYVHKTQMTIDGVPRVVFNNNIKSS